MTVLVGRPAPDFTADAVFPDGSIQPLRLSEFQGKYVVLFFWPLNFTFVCPSEIIAHDRRNAAFIEKNVQLIGVSIDNPYSHYAWRQTPTDKGGIGEVQFPMVSDYKQSIMKAYGIEAIGEEAGKALRASFLIDREGIVQHQVVNNFPLGREVDEMLRLVDALQFTEEHGEVCPAGWRKGDSGMKPTTAGVADYLAANAARL